MTDSDDERDWPFWTEVRDVQRAGGLIDPGYLDEFHRMACGYVRHFFRSAISTHRKEYYADQFDGLSLFFINSPTPNAIALERQQKRGVGVHLGAVRHLWWLFYRGVSTGQFLEHWFKSKPLGADISLEAAMADPIWREPGAGRLPADRAETMFDLFLRALDFLVYHELAHHARGHLPYVQEILGLDKLDEALNASVSEGADKKILRLIEFDADVEALDMLLVALDHEIPVTSWPSEKAGTEFFLHAVAILAIFQLFDLDHTPVSEQYRRSHPASVHRALRVTGALSRAIGRQVGWTEDVRIDQHDTAWYAASEVATLIGMPEGRWRGQHTKLMDLDRFAVEEESFIKFSKRLTDRNMADLSDKKRHQIQNDS